MKKYLLIALVSLGFFSFSNESHHAAFSKEMFAEVDKSLEGYLVKTPLVFLPSLSELVGKKVYLKDEARQKGNSFKTRGVTFEVFQTVKDVITQNPEKLKAGLQLVTQTDGNHGIALILAVTSAIKKYAAEYPLLAEDIKKIEPIIFTYKTILSVKRTDMDAALKQYRASVGLDQGKIYDTYKDYGDARQAREKYISESNGKAQYMEHGGIKTMHGHGVAAIEILEQLQNMGVKEDQNVCLLLPIGAGGPIGLAAALKAYHPKSSSLMIQTPRYDAFVRSLKSGKMELNDSSLSPYTVEVGTKAVVYEDGISVDGPESEEALGFARRFINDGLSANPKAALKLSPLILGDLDRHYNSEAIVGGTTAILAEALLSNKENSYIKEADVIVLFGTEGSIDPAIAKYTRDLLNESKLVDIQSLAPKILIDLKYSTKDNFTNEIVYNFQRCLLVKEAAEKLCAIQKELEARGLGLKVWDGFRPVAAQWKFWELVPDERYVSDPRKGGRHTRGTAVDLTLVTLDGKELPMPSGFDDFSEKAHRDYKKCSKERIRNRELLQEIMERHGFIGLPTEWWHFDLVGWENHPPIDFTPA